MQGTLNEIDIRSILQLIELGQRTGELFVEAFPRTKAFIPGDYWRKSAYVGSSGQFWFVFFVNGQIAYAADQSHNNLSRLRDYLRRYKADLDVTDLPISTIETTNAPEYACIWLLLEKNIITPAQGRSIIESMIQETLFDLLSLHQGSFIFDLGMALAPQLLNLETAPLVNKIMKQVQEWKQFHPHIQNPNQYVVIADESKLRTALSEQAYKSLSRWADGKSSLRQLSRYLNRELLAIARAIFPYAERGWVQMVSPELKKKGNLAKIPDGKDTINPPHILCIDDDITIGKNVEHILKQNGYQVTIITDPLEALGLVFKIEPDLILCDISMPNLEGNELCAMLRQSTVFRQIPIIMLTGREAFIDRVRARMVGATDYLTKPFGATELLLLLEQYLGSNLAGELKI